MPNSLPFLLDVNASQYTFQLIDADNITLNDSEVNNQMIPAVVEITCLPGFK
jgi:hypothetical protein